MGPATVIYGVLMLLTGAAAWVEVDALSWSVAVPLAAGALATPLGFLAGDLRARRAAIAVVALLAAAALLASIPGTLATFALFAGDSVPAADAAAAQATSFTLSVIYLVVAATAFAARRRASGQANKGPRSPASEPNPSAGYAFMGR